ncbi:MAG: (d)CMP kinase [Candidatus Sericytochromatia bacterium]|nr:(d)CMP kinase [Candidatus Sericytochromatia bacterium]
MPPTEPLEPRLTIAIDGPAGAGKSTAARRVAETLGYVYVDSGAMYRAITLLALRQGVPPEDVAALTALTNRTTLTLLPSRDAGIPGRVQADGEDITEAIRTPEVTANVSLVSSHAPLRERLVARQRELSNHGGVVMDGGDIGTVVFPQAELKVFLVASVHERARRRHLENLAKGLPSQDIATQEAEIARRDAFDSSRAASPLKPAADAIHLDTSNMTLDQVVHAIVQLYQQVKAKLTAAGRA